MQDPAVLERRERSSFRRTSSHSPVRRAARPVFRFSFSFSLLHPPCSFPCAFFPVRLSLSTFVQYFWSFLPSPWQRSLCAVPAGQGASSGFMPCHALLVTQCSCTCLFFFTKDQEKEADPACSTCVPCRAVLLQEPGTSVDFTRLPAAVPRRPLNFC